MKITEEYLKEHPDHIFIFGDNLLHKGTGGAASSRNKLNTYGFITKKYPSMETRSFFTSYEYIDTYNHEICLLKAFIQSNPNKTFLVSKLGGGLANRFHIFERVIEPRMKKDLKGYENVKFLW